MFSADCVPPPMLPVGRLLRRDGRVHRVAAGERDLALDRGVQQVDDRPGGVLNPVDGHAPRGDLREPYIVANDLLLVLAVEYPDEQVPVRVVPSGIVCDEMMYPRSCSSSSPWRTGSTMRLGLSGTLPTVGPMVAAASFHRLPSSAVTWFRAVRSKWCQMYPVPHISFLSTESYVIGADTGVVDSIDSTNSYWSIRSPISIIIVST